MKAARITIAHGDGIGPEIMAATLDILAAAGANLSYDTIEIGQKAYERGQLAGIDDAAWDILLQNKVLLKAPLTTPQGSGYKSVNVTLRKSLGLFANVRPCRAYTPFLRSRHPDMDLVIVRENEEDLYAGIEHRQTEEVYQCLKLISRPGCERIVRYAFEYARRHKRQKVSCLSKDNIMKMTDGLFHRVFDEIAAEYPELEKEHCIVDFGAARLADNPGSFDVIVMPNLYGDILSDVAAQIAGSIGIGASANLGEHGSMFEAIHGSAPSLAGLNEANPSGLLLAAVQMLVHLGQGKVAEKIHNAWLRTIEDGIHTADMYQEGQSQKKASTKSFAQALQDRLGEEPKELPAVRYEDAPAQDLSYQRKSSAKALRRELVGVDVFLFEAEKGPSEIAERLLQIAQSQPFELQVITNRGVKVWPKGLKETFCTDHWRCRFVAVSTRAAAPDDIWKLLWDLSNAGFDVIKSENLYLFDGEKGYSIAQGC